MTINWIPLYGELVIPPVEYTTVYVQRKRIKGWYWEVHSTVGTVLSCGPFWTQRGAERARQEIVDANPQGFR